MTTKIYCYCLFDRQGTFYGVYSSLKAIHRDALKITNRASSEVVLMLEGKSTKATLTNLRNALKGKTDTQIIYASGAHRAKIIKSTFIE